MNDDAHDRTATKPDAEALKRQLKPALEGLSREDILSLGDFIFDEARRLATNRNRAWRYLTPTH